MIDIFTVIGSDIVLTVEILSLKPFRELIERDNSKNKIYSRQEMLYIYHFASYKSLGVKKGMADFKLKEHAIDNSGLPLDYQPDALVMEAIKVYKDIQYTALDEQYVLLQTVSNTRNKALETIKNKLALLVLTIDEDKSLAAFMNYDKMFSEYIIQLQKDTKLLADINKQLQEAQQIDKKAYGATEYQPSMDSDDDLSKFEKED